MLALRTVSFPRTNSLLQTKCHQFLIEILIAQLERVAFQAIGLEAQRDKEMTGFPAGEHDTQVDLFKSRQGLRIGNSCLQQCLSSTFSARLSRHIHTPDDTPVASLDLFLSSEASNTYKLLFFKRSKC